MTDTLDELTRILEARKSADAGESYVASLHQKGLDAILKKVGEESAELLMAAKDVEHGADPGAMVRETADLWFHCMVLLSRYDLSAADVVTELGRRLNVSGHAEKASRTKNEGD